MRIYTRYCQTKLIRLISRLLNENNIHSKLKRKFKATTYSNHKYPVTPNLLEQNFKAEKPNEKWVGDITYITTDEGWLYLAAIEDLFQKEVVGWSLNTRMTREITIVAMEQAIKKHSPTAGLIFHSYCGIQYAAYDYQELLRKNQRIQSMRRKGNCYDNACVESFFASLKKDLIYGRRFKTIAEAKLAIVDYIEAFYNCKQVGKLPCKKSGGRKHRLLYNVNRQFIINCKKPSLQMCTSLRLQEIR